MVYYKGFKKDLTCRGFQYKEGVWQHVSDEASLCEAGVHACEAPLDVLGYYPPATSQYREVELSGVSSERREDSKVVATDIKVGAELGIPGLVKAHIEYVKSRTTFEHTDPKQATAGDSGAATSRGKSKTGEDGVCVARGNDVKVCGGLGSLLVIAEEARDSYSIVAWRAVIVDGEIIKPDTWYALKDGELVEVK